MNKGKGGIENKEISYCTSFGQLVLHSLQLLPELDIVFVQAQNTGFHIFWHTLS